MVDFDVIFKLVVSNEVVTVMHIAFININSGYPQTLGFNQGVVIFHHCSVADSHVQDGGGIRKIIETILVTMVSYITDYQFV
jgi:hypothetical protein